MKALINLGSEVNAIHLVYATKLSLYIKKVNIGVQKINRSYISTFRIVMVDCLLKNKLGKI